MAKMANKPVITEEKTIAWEKRYTLAYERKAIQSHQDKGQHGNIFHSYMPFHQAPTKSILIFWELNDTLNIDKFE
jgi:hypothetical protein